VREVAELLNGMREASVVTDYALFGAAAQMRYTEAVATLDADVAARSSGRLEPFHPEVLRSQAMRNCSLDRPHGRRAAWRSPGLRRFRQAERLRSSIETIRKERRRQLRRDQPGSRNDGQTVRA
jgi:hypothetical protein